MIGLSVYQHRVLPQKALVTSSRDGWVEFYIEDHPELSYLETQVFLDAYTLYAPLAKPLFTAEELVVLREQAQKAGILVPVEFLPAKR